MRLRSIALAVCLAFCATGLAEAAKKPHVVKHKVTRMKVRKYNAKKAQKQARKVVAKHKQRA